jgi:hypothetical protein
MSDTKRKIAIVVVLGLVILFGVGQFFAGNPIVPPSQNNGNSQPPTQVIPYVPPAPASSTAIAKGSCFSSSIAAPYRTDAWRCMVGNMISDPCFAIPSSKNLACGENPAGTDTSSTFVLQLTKSLPKPEVPSGTIPSNGGWLVELGDGTLCSPFTGTRPFSATGDVATYACNASLKGEDMIFGDLNNASSVWTAEVGALSNTTSTFPPVIVASTTVPIFAVWQ